METAHRWDARPLSKDPRRPLDGSVCATVWPTRALQTDERWFDEVYVWTEGFEASTTQRGRIQILALELAFRMLELEQADHVGVTLSFGTVERFLDQTAQVFQEHALVSQRLAVMMRGTVDRIRSPYRLRAFINHLRAQQIPVGFRVSSPRVTMDLQAIDFFQPEFAKVLAPPGTRPEAWHDFVLEARVAGIPAERLIVSALEKPAQLALARQAGIGFGQGPAVRPAYAPDVPEHLALPPLVGSAQVPAG